MRLIDADEIVKYIEELKTPDAPLIARIFLDNVELFVKNTPTVDAIPVEQAARMLQHATSDLPCDGVGMSPDLDDWCKKQDCEKSDFDVYDCWLHAIKEGWLDE